MKRALEVNKRFFSPLAATLYTGGPNLRKWGWTLFLSTVLGICLCVFIPDFLEKMSCSWRQMTFMSCIQPLQAHDYCQATVWTALLLNINFVIELAHGLSSLHRSCLVNHAISSHPLNLQMLLCRWMFITSIMSSLALNTSSLLGSSMNSALVSPVKATWSSWPHLNTLFITMHMLHLLVETIKWSWMT